MVSILKHTRPLGLAFVILLTAMILASALPYHAYAESIEKEQEFYNAVVIINETIPAVKNAQNLVEQDPQQAKQVLQSVSSNLTDALDIVKAVLEAEGKDYEAVKQEILSGDKEYSMQDYYVAIAKTGIYVEEALANITNAITSIDAGDKANAKSNITSALSALRSAYKLGLATYNTAIANRSSPTYELAITGLVLASLVLYFIASHKLEKRPATK